MHKKILAEIMQATLVGKIKIAFEKLDKFLFCLNNEWKIRNK